MFWDLYLSLLEQAQTPIAKITTVYKAALNSGIPPSPLLLICLGFSGQEHEYKALITRYFDIRVRHSRAGQTTQDLQDLREELKWATEYIQQCTLTSPSLSITYQALLL